MNTNNRVHDAQILYRKQYLELLSLRKEYFHKDDDYKPFNPGKLFDKTMKESKIFAEKEKEQLSVLRGMEMILTVILGEENIADMRKTVEEDFKKSPPVRSKYK